MLSVIIPAHNEGLLIGGCLRALLASTGADNVQVIVAANGCTDQTAALAQGFAAQVAERGWSFSVLDLPQGGKPAALNAADALASYPNRAYLDADVTVSPDLLAQTIAALVQPAPVYASGRVRITGRGPVARAYAAFWSTVPFMAQGVPGCGYFAVNAAGRARWGVFPQIISDDTFVRLQFAPAERVLLNAPYDWPIAEGFANLVKVRRRQDAGVAEITRLYPTLHRNDGTPPVRKLPLALRNPLAFAVYSAVAVMVRLSPSDLEWSRGR